VLDDSVEFKVTDLLEAELEDKFTYAPGSVEECKIQILHPVA